MHGVNICYYYYSVYKIHLAFIPAGAHIVEWSPSGEKYVVVILNKIDVYQLHTAAVSGTITNEKRVSSIAFLSVSSQTCEFVLVIRPATDPGHLPVLTPRTLSSRWLETKK